VTTEPRSEPLLSTASAERFERLFLPSSGSASKLGVGLGMLGCAALGAGVYGTWLAPHTPSASPALLIGGLVMAAVAWFIAPKEAPPVRVGELGVIVGDPAEARRLYWHEIDAVRIDGDALLLASKELPVSLSLAAHARAAARLIAEASQRIAARVDISPRAHERLPRLADAEGQRVPAARLQLTGRRCAASDTVITFENDARLCANCAAIYHVSHVPAACVRCDRPLAPSSDVARAAS
jgi:hypothetical protein